MFHDRYGGESGGYGSGGYGGGQSGGYGGGQVKLKSHFLMAS